MKKLYALLVLCFLFGASVLFTFQQFEKNRQLDRELETELQRQDSLIRLLDAQISNPVYEQTKVGSK